MKKSSEMSDFEKEVFVYNLRRDVIRTIEHEESKVSQVVLCQYMPTRREHIAGFVHGMVYNGMLIEHVEPETDCRTKFTYYTVGDISGLKAPRVKKSSVKKPNVDKRAEKVLHCIDKIGLQATRRELCRATRLKVAELEPVINTMIANGDIVEVSLPASAFSNAKVVYRKPCNRNL